MRSTGTEFSGLGGHCLLFVRIRLSPIVLLAVILAAGCATPQSPEPLATADNASSWADAYQAASGFAACLGAAAASLQKSFSSLTDAFPDHAAH